MKSLFIALTEYPVYQLAEHAVQATSSQFFHRVARRVSSTRGEGEQNLSFFSTFALCGLGPLFPHTLFETSEGMIKVDIVMMSLGSLLAT